MNRFEKYGQNCHKALEEKEAAIWEELEVLKKEGFEKKIEFLKRIPAAQSELLERILDDIKAMQSNNSSHVQEVVSPPRVYFGKGALAGVLVGVLMGATTMFLGGLYLAKDYQDPQQPLVMSPQTLANSLPSSGAERTSETPRPTQENARSRWSSAEEEEVYLNLAKANGGLALAEHCRGEGRVEVEIGGVRRNACLVWPPGGNN